MNKNTNKIFLLINLIFSPVLFSMDQPLQGNALVLNLVATHYLFDHEAVCSFAATNKANNKLMLAAAEQKKKLLSNQLWLELSCGTLRHKYGSAYYYVHQLGVQGLKLKHCRLDATGTAEVSSSFFSGFLFPLPHEPAPFFNNAGVLCFYGFGKMNIPSETSENFVFGYRQSQEIMRYSSDRLALRCSLISQKSKIVDSKLSYFLEYPALLKAILNSTIVCEKKKYDDTNNVIEEYLEYSLEGVTIPDNYAEKIPYTYDGNRFSFDELSEPIRTAIIQRYKEQSKNGVGATP